MFFCCVSIIYFIFLIFLICFNDITVSFLAKNGNVWYIINDDEMKETKKKRTCYIYWICKYKTFYKTFNSMNMKLTDIKAKNVFYFLFFYFFT